MFRAKILEAVLMLLGGFPYAAAEDPEVPPEVSSTFAFVHATVLGVSENWGYLILGSL